MSSNKSNQKIIPGTTTTDKDNPQIPRPDLRFVRKIANQTKNGAGAQNQDPQKQEDLPKSQWGQPIVIITKTCTLTKTN